MQLKPQSAVGASFIPPLQPFSPFDGNGLPLRSRIRQARGQTAPASLVSCTLSQSLEARIVRNICHGHVPFWKEGKAENRARRSGLRRLRAKGYKKEIGRER